MASLAALSWSQQALKLWRVLISAPGQGHTPRFNRGPCQRRRAEPPTLKGKPRCCGPHAGASAPKVQGDKPAPGKGGAAPGDAHVPDEGLLDTHVAIKHLGTGGSGQTWLYREKATGREVAIKLVKRPIPKVISPNILREIKIQAQLGEGHINIIDAYECLVTAKHLALVMEFASGGSLTAYVAERWQQSQGTGLFLSEDEARYFFQLQGEGSARPLLLSCHKPPTHFWRNEGEQFIGAVEYCHEHNVAHRDLKLDNTLLSNADPPILKLCDFGFAKEWDSNNANMYTHIGTPVYMSPEIINNRNGQKGYDGKSVDVWASGVLLLVMLLGQFPFDHLEHPDPNSSAAHLEVWMQQVKQPWEKLPHLANVLDKLSPEVKELLDQIFVIDSAKRITTAEIKKTPWYNKPLLPHHQAALDGIHRRQVDIAEHARERRTSEGYKEEQAELVKQLQRALTECAMVGRPQGDSPESRRRSWLAAQIHAAASDHPHHPIIAGLHRKQAAVEARNAALDRAVDECLGRATAPPQAAPLIRINLREHAVLDGGGGAAGEKAPGSTPGGGGAAPPLGAAAARDGAPAAAAAGGGRA